MDKFTTIVLCAMSLLSLALLLIENHGKVVPIQYKNDHSSTILHIYSNQFTF